MTQATGVEPVVRSVTVSAPQISAFELFTEGIGRWWPLGTHSVLGDRAETVVFEGKVDGRIFERSGDGEEVDWGRVIVWEPPNRILFSWSPEPGTEVPTEVEVTFTTEAGATRVELHHRGWERLGDQGPVKRSSYSAVDGWTLVIDAYDAASNGS
jgi:uncharacterized protein YndB with AHSA1/START domain